MDEHEELGFVRLPLELLIVYTVAYASIFVIGFFGNMFILLSIKLHPSLRTAADHLICSLALADVCIMLFCLPTTLMNNTLTEWPMGNIGCKLSTFLNSTISCASVYTLVAVTIDRFMAICFTLKYDKYTSAFPAYATASIWVISASLASPNLLYYEQVEYDLMPPNKTYIVKLCVSNTENEFLHFLLVNVLVAFALPCVVIIVCYGLIFRTVVRHRSLAVDARIRDERVKLRVAKMMLTVIVNFMLCWTPLYALYCYLLLTPAKDTWFFGIASSVLRPAFQWLSLLSSAINPIIYTAYSRKYRIAFQQLLLLPCQVRLQNIRSGTLSTSLRFAGSARNVQFAEPRTDRWSLPVNTSPASPTNDAIYAKRYRASNGNTPQTAKKLHGQGHSFDIIDPTGF